MKINQFILVIALISIQITQPQDNFLNRQYKSLKNDLNLIRKCYGTTSPACTKNEREQARNAVLRVGAKTSVVLIALAAAASGGAYAGYRLLSRKRKPGDSEKVKIDESQLGQGAQTSQEPQQQKEKKLRKKEQKQEIEENPELVALQREAEKVLKEPVKNVRRLMGALDIQMDTMQAYGKVVAKLNYDEDEVTAVKNAIGMPRFIITAPNNSYQSYGDWAE